MIKSYTATTREIDDPKVAAAEILKQLDIKNNLLKNSLGIISCYAEFGETGALKAVCDALPFDCIGATTCLCASGADVDFIMLSVTVLTSDDCFFKTTAVKVEDGYEKEIDSAFKKMFKDAGGKPSLIFSYFPLLHTVSGDMILKAADKATGGVPLFGTVALDHTLDYSLAQTIHNGKMVREAAVFGAVFGDAEVKFDIASLDEDRIRKQKAVITASSGNILIGVNGKSALEYLEEIGLKKEELAAGLGIVPFVVDYGIGTKPLTRAVFALTPEGHAVCGGEMPVNATLSIGHIDAATVLNTTEKTAAALSKSGGAVLSYSCMGRFLSLGAENTLEAEKIRGAMGKTNYQFACSSGEICPLQNNNGKLVNLFHNHTIVFCQLC